ncbi:hypothetical protein LR48_Vigan10g169600 [Vigna angularis]|uniref:Uncharacterized protein n=1 Tax=Phaseolus angularis TaxID=3914 RepID=A0A0L9VM31_PHAAN|nr:hypothetical protein LR48_Vigan10g169600 [Vigna angularis]
MGPNLECCMYKARYPKVDMAVMVQEKPSTEILSILVDMGFTFEEACTTIDKCAEIDDLVDFISASQLEDEIDSLQDLHKNKHVASVDTQTEVRFIIL